jgi:hypothetical protein
LARNRAKAIKKLGFRADLKWLLPPGKPLTTGSPEFTRLKFGSPGMSLRIVALGEGDHGNEQGAAFRAKLYRDPRFQAVVNDIVVESGNGRHQAMMDRYIAGDTVPEKELRMAWLETTQRTEVWDRDIYADMFRTIREINQKLPKAKQLRVLLGDTPYTTYDPANPAAPTPRTDRFPAELIQREVIAKKRKALVVYGEYMLENMIKGYEAGLSHGVPDDDDIPEPIDRILQQAFKRRWRNLAEERIKDVTPTIPLGRRFWALTVAENKEIARLVALPETQELITRMRHRHEKDELAVLDGAYWVKGCSSLGRLRYAVLIGIGKPSSFGKSCLVDIKEAVIAAAPRYAKSSMPRDNAKRVVEGARNLSPFLGERMLAARFLDRSVVIRELLPQDLKLEMERLTQEEEDAFGGLL